MNEATEALSEKQRADAVYSRPGEDPARHIARLVRMYREGTFTPSAWSWFVDENHVMIDSAFVKCVQIYVNPGYQSNVAEFTCKPGSDINEVREWVQRAFDVQCHLGLG